MGCGDELVGGRMTDAIVVHRGPLSAGLYQFSVDADGRDFDWESLYVDLADFGNAGRRTGPWDFAPVGGPRPLLPSYWVDVNGRRLGLWYMQRPTVQDVESRRFRGRFAFHVPIAGDHVVALTPWRPTNIGWESSGLAPDPEDRLAPLPGDLRAAPGNVSAARWREPEFWADQRQFLTTTHAMYRRRLGAAFDWIWKSDDTGVSAENIPGLIAGYWLDGRADGIERALRIVDHFSSLETWGQADPEQYGYAGDIGAMTPLRCLSWAYHMIGDPMGEFRRRRLGSALAARGNAFVEQALLNRDYWGGSLLQDHGWKSMFGFGTAALHLYGVVPDAEHWLTWILPRIERMLAACPPDGVPANSSYGNLHNWLGMPSHYRDVWAALSGVDIFRTAPFRGVVDFCWTTIREDERRMACISPCGDVQAAIGVVHFFNRLASAFDDGRAAWLARWMLEVEMTASEFYGPGHERTYYEAALWGLLSFDPRVRPADGLARPFRQLSHWVDAGVVHYRSDPDNVSLSLQCGPHWGAHASRASTCPCDNGGGAPRAGHFSLTLGATPTLVTPEEGYRLATELGSVLLIDGQGQVDDIGYPMVIPQKRHAGERVETVQWDEASGRGEILLALGPAYPPELGVRSYRRQFAVAPGRRLVVRDEVELARPRRLSWLFHGRSEHGLVCEEGLRYRFGGPAGLSLEPRGPALAASVRETPIVWSYASVSGRRPVDHVRYDTINAVARAAVDFVIEW